MGTEQGSKRGETVHWHCCLVWALIPRSRGNGSGWVSSDDCINREKGVFSQMRVTEFSPSSVQAPAASVGFKAGILFVHLYFTKGFIPYCLIWSLKSSEVGRICYIPNLQMSILKSRGVYPKVTMIVSGRAGSHIQTHQSHIQRYWPNFSNALQGHNYSSEADQHQHHDKHRAFFHMLCTITIMPRGIKIAGSFLTPCRLPLIEAISIIHRIQPSSKLSGKS